VNSVSGHQVGNDSQEVAVDMNVSQEHLFVQELIMVVHAHWSVAHRSKPQGRDANLWVVKHLLVSFLTSQKVAKFIYRMKNDRVILNADVKHNDEVTPVPKHHAVKVYTGRASTRWKWSASCSVRFNPGKNPGKEMHAHILPCCHFIDGGHVRDGVPIVCQIFEIFTILRLQETNARFVM